jgi:CHAT domain-containing protein/tetratricopeptide (TPR) repeat protein
MATSINLQRFRLSALVFFLATNPIPAQAQAPAAEQQTKLAAAQKEFTEASDLGNRGDREAKLVAIKRLEAIEKVFEEFDDKERLAGTLTVRGMFLSAVGSPGPAIEALDRAVSVYKSADIDSGAAAALFGLGNIYYKQTAMERARDLLEEARIHIEKQPFQSFDLNIYTLLGNVYIALRDRTKATEVLWTAYVKAKDRTDREAVNALVNYADAQIKLQTPKLALSFYEIALKRAQAAKLKDVEPRILNSIGELYLNHLEEPAKAKPYIDEALAAADAANDMSAKCVALYNLGYYNYVSIRMDEALSSYERSRTLAVQIGNKSYSANLANSTGLVYLFLNDSKRAIPYFEQAVALAHETGEKQIEVQALANLAKSQVAVNDSKGAIASYTSALAVATEYAKSGFLGLRPTIVGLLIDFGTFALQAGNRNDAMEIFTKALEKSREWDQRAHEAGLLNNIAKIHQLNGDDAEALAMFNSSLALSRSLGTRYSEAKTLENLMEVWSKLGNRNFAAFYGKNAINIYQDFRKGLQSLSLEEQKSYLKTVENVYRQLASLLVAQGRISEAEQVLVMLKEEELIDYVRRDDDIAKAMLEKLALTDDERSALTRYEATAGQLTAIGKEFSELETERVGYPAGAFPKQKRYDELKQQLADATVAFGKFLDELKTKFGQNDVRVTQVDSSLKKTLDRLKANRTAVVSTIVGDDTLSIIVTTRKAQRAHSVKVSATEINDLVAKFRTGLSSPVYDPRVTGQKLYDLIVKPIEGDLAGIKADMIVWSLDGTLRYIPPAALWDKKNGYLAERFSNVIVNLASRDTLSSPGANGQKLSVLGVGVSKPVETFSALSAVPDELDCIVSDTTVGILSTSPQCSKGVLTGRKLLDETFTLSNFENELGRYPVVHIASHFKLTPGDDKNSFLLLGGGEERRFTVEKLRTEPLTDVELIVLSACNTATPGGTKANGIEIEGFGSIAQKEGAKAVMATLWSVADSSTKDFMVEFYRLYGNEGKSKAVAMQLAQLKLLHGNYSAEQSERHRAESFVAGGSNLPKFVPDPKAPFAHPFYWSPFILIGNWQ